MTQTSSETQPVPPLNLAANFRELREELLAEITAICDSGAYILGPKVAAFEDALAAYCGAKHCVAVSSGTDALLMALMALELRPDDEVIVPSFTFFATAGTVIRAGGTPVFCDVDAASLNAGNAEIAQKITQRTRAIMPVHLYGQLTDMRPLESLAENRGITIIEDACQAIGALEPGSSGRFAGAIGHYGALSFYPTKNLGAIGDAGALLTNDPARAENARKMRIHGSGHTYYHDFVGGNFRIDALQAAILTIKLRRLDSWTTARRARAHRYNQLFANEGLSPEFVRIPEETFGVHVYHQYVIRTSRRDALAEYLRSRKIGCGVYYPVPLHLQKCFANLGGKPGDCPHSEKAAAEVLALPIYPELTDIQQQTVVAAIGAFFRS